jgi:prolyl-tRNA editing enzyme YbaK/EbsC (Cys-tRNA(Pro) deacylase)
VNAAVDAVARVEQLLADAGMTDRVRRLEDSARTAAEAAAALGCDVGAIASSLVFEADGEPVLVVTSGAHRVDTALVADRTRSGEARRTRSAPRWSATGYVIGGVSPVGHPAPLRTLLDAALASYPVLWASAGHPHAVLHLTLDELRALTGAPVVHVARD